MNQFQECSTLSVRDLPEEEWEKLRDHPSLGGHPLPHPKTSRAIVVERDGEIVGVWFAIQVVHLEPIWLKKEERSTGAGLLLFRGMKRLLDSCSLKRVFSFSDNPVISAYLGRLGFVKLPYEIHALEV